MNINTRSTIFAKNNLIYDEKRKILSERKLILITKKIFTRHKYSNKFLLKQIISLKFCFI